MTPSWLKYTKIPPQTGRGYYILIEKWPITAFFFKAVIKYNSNTFYEE
jgi:hypothetical protein